MECTIEIYINNSWKKAAVFSLADNDRNKGIRASGRIDYDLDYYIEFLDHNRFCHISCNYPLSLDLRANSRWPAFLLDILPSGAGRRFWLNRLGLPDNETSDWDLLINGTGYPPGNLRIAEAIKNQAINNASIGKHKGFSREEIIERNESFIEYAVSLGASVAGSSDIHGDSPKLLLTQDKQGNWHTDGAISDNLAQKHWLIKFPRGRTQRDFSVLRNEARYYEVAEKCGLYTGQPLYFEQNVLFIPRFDRKVVGNYVEKYGLESMYSLAEIAEYGRYLSHDDCCSFIARFSSAPVSDLYEYIKRDILNVALGNTDNHGRNTSMIKYPDGSIKLSPLYDFAPMFLDSQGIPRTSKWKSERTGIPEWGKVAESLSSYLDVPQLKKFLSEYSSCIAKLPDTMKACSVDDDIIQKLSGRIENTAESLKA